jgi:hypothetical protein
LIFEVSNTMFLSRDDIAHSLVFLILLFAVGVTVYLLGFRLSVGEGSFFVVSILPVVKRTAVIVLIPLAIDFLMLYLLNLLVRKKGYE